MRTVSYYKQEDRPGGPMLPSPHHRVDAHGTIRRTFPKISKKLRRARRETAAKFAREAMRSNVASGVRE